MGGLRWSSWVAGALLLCIVWTCNVFVEGKDPNGSTESLTLYTHFTPDFVVVAGPGNGHTDISLIDFGSILVADGNVTEGPSPTSKVVGRRQGVGIRNNLLNTNYFLAYTVIFENHDKYDGTLQLAGTEIGSGHREISIIGGTGDFRGARGYSTFHEIDGADYPIIEQDFVLYKDSFNYKAYPESEAAGLRIVEGFIQLQIVP